MFDFDLDECDPNEQDKNIASMGNIPPGKYLAILTNAIEKPVNGKTVSELKFTVDYGPFKGRKVQASLFHEGNDAEKTAKMRSQLIYFGEKLGLLSREEKNGKKSFTYLAGRTSFEDCIDGTQVVINVEIQKDQNDKTKEYCKVKMFGVFALTDKEAKGVSGVPEMEGSAVGAGAGSSAVEDEIDV